MKYKIVGWSLESKSEPEANILTLLRVKEKKRDSIRERERDKIKLL